MPGATPQQQQMVHLPTSQTGANIQRSSPIGYDPRQPPQSYHGAIQTGMQAQGSSSQFGGQTATPQDYQLLLSALNSTERQNMQTTSFQYRQVVPQASDSIQQRQLQQLQQQQQQQYVQSSTADNVFLSSSGWADRSRSVV